MAAPTSGATCRFFLPTRGRPHMARLTYQDVKSDRQSGDKRAEIYMNRGDLNRSRPVAVIRLFRELGELSGAISNVLTVCLPFRGTLLNPP